MKRILSVAVGILATGCMAFPSLAAEVNLGTTIVGAFPVGAFAEKENIIDQAPYGWSARGGGAETGFGFNLELETRIAKVVMAGFRFGYVKYGADAADVRAYINDILSRLDPSGEVTALDATWTHTFMSFPFRFIARDFSSGRTYVRLDIGWVKATNGFDGNIRFDDPPGETGFASEFNLGNQFFLAVGAGLDIRVGEKYAVITEVRYTHIFSDGSEATASVAGSVIRAEQRFDTQTVEVAVGVRIPISGI
jgi:opacity protein-like surface antigen